jgi:hypothetical protein
MVNGSRELFLPLNEIAPGINPEGAHHVNGFFLLGQGGLVEGALVLDPGGGAHVLDLLVAGRGQQLVRGEVLALDHAVVQSR